MKKNILIIIFVILVSGILVIVKTKNTVNVGKINNTSMIAIGYGWNSHLAVINNPEEIKQLENLFNKATFSVSDRSIEQPYLSLVFKRNDSSTVFHIDKQNSIRLEDGSYVTSEQILFEEIYSIFNEYARNKKAVTE